MKTWGRRPGWKVKGKYRRICVKVKKLKHLQWFIFLSVWIFSFFRCTNVSPKVPESVIVTWLLVIRTVGVQELQGWLFSGDLWLFYFVAWNKVELLQNVLSPLQSAPFKWEGYFDFLAYCHSRISSMKEYTRMLHSTE